MEKAFLKYLKKITPKTQFLNGFKATVLDLWQEKGHEFELEVKRYEKELSDLEAKRKRTFEMREDGSYTREDFTERKGQIENEIAAVKISLSEARIEQFDIEAALTYANNFISDLGRQWFDLLPNLRPKFQKLVFPEGIPYKRDEGFGTAKLGLIFEINRHSHGNLSHVVDPAVIETGSDSIAG